MKRSICLLLSVLTFVSVFLFAPVASAKDELKNTDPDKYYIVLDLKNQTVTVYERDENGEYTRIVRRFICSTGKTVNAPSDDPDAALESTPTPTGVWKIGGRERFGKFAKFSEYARYWTQLVADNYFHSVMFKKRDV
ncbi:MAG: L,D-transpeptidase, partial [Clostridia bacterium]|nr:L,D-transpeptidase [Clostridia bacterium]